MAEFNPSLVNIKLSPIVKISEEVRALAPEFEKGGQKMLYLQRGELDFSTPQYISDGLQEGISKGYTRYPKSGGEPWFKEALVEKLKNFNKASDLKPENIIVTYGGQESLELMFQLFFEKEGAGFSPCWSCVLENFVPYSRVKFHEVPLEDDFSIDYDKLEDMVKKVEFLYVNNPQNPTGKVFTYEELEKIVEICSRHDKYIISDEAYERIVFDGKEHISMIAFPYEKILGAFTFSKTYCMTGWRLGYIVTRDPQIAKMFTLGNYTQTAGVTTFLQYAGMKAVTNAIAEKEAIDSLVSKLQARRNLMYEGLSSIEGLRIEKPEGAFYMFPNFTEFIPKDLTGEERALYIYKKLLSHGIATVYGSCFGTHFSDNVRLSFSTTPQSEILDCIERFKKIFQ